MVTTTTRGSRSYGGLPMGAGAVCEGSSRSSQALLESARAGSTADFQVLCERWRGPLLNFATSYCKGDQVTAQDIVQETFLTAWEKIDQIKDAEHLRPWLYRVARFKSINWLRKYRPRGRVTLSIEYAAERGHSVADEGADPLEHVLRAEPGSAIIEALYRAIDRLPALYVAVVRLHYLRRLTSREVSLLLQLKQTTVKMRLLRARQILKPLVLEELRTDRERRAEEAGG